MKKVLWILLCILLLAGCGAKPGDGEEKLPLTVADGEVVSGDEFLENTAAEEADGAGYLRYDSAALPGGILRATAQCMAGDRIYVGGLTQDGAVLARTDWNGEEGTLDLPEGIEYIFALCPTESGFALLGGSLPAVYEDWDGSVIFPENADGALQIVCFDQTGAETGSVALHEAYTDGFFQLLAAEDSYYLLSVQRLLQIGPDGAELGQLTPPDDYNWLIGMAQYDGEVYILNEGFMQRETITLLKLNRETLETETQLELPDTTIFGFGQAEDGMLLLSYAAEDKKELAALDPETGALTGLYDWKLLGGVISADWVSQWGQDYVFFTIGGDKLERLRWTAGERPERVTLQMAATGAAEISQLVQEFNFSQDVYTIEVTTYAEEGDKPLDLLRTELLTGNVPDLYCFGNYSSEGCQTGGVDLATFGMDLMPYLEADSDFGPADFVTNLLAGMEQDGALYALPLAFTITTCVTPVELIAEPGITPAELEAVREQAGDSWATMNIWNDANNLLGWTVPFLLSTYVDREAGTCSFDSQEFQDYLAWCRDWGGPGYVEGEPYDPPEHVILRVKSVNTPEEVYFLGYTAQYGGYSGYTYTGLPVEEGYGSMFEVCMELGISAATEHADGAWAFLHYCLTRQTDVSELFHCMPVLQAVIDQEVAWYQSGEAVDYDGSPEIARQEDVDRFYQLLNQTTVVGSDDTTLEEIIRTEAEIFFSGGCTAEQAASNIQNRASLYVMERYG